MTRHRDDSAPVTAGRYPNFADPAAACTELDVAVYDAVVYGDVVVRVTGASDDAGAGVRQGQPDRYLREHWFPGVTVSDEVSEVSLWALGAGFTLDRPGWTCQDRTWYAHYTR